MYFKGGIYYKKTALTYAIFKGLKLQQSVYKM